MKVFLLFPIESQDTVGFDAKVIVAPDEESARYEANLYTAGEGQIWEDRSKVTCKEVDMKKTYTIWSSFAGYSL